MLNNPIAAHEQLCNILPLVPVPDAYLLCRGGVPNERPANLCFSVHGHICKLCVSVYTHTHIQSHPSTYVVPHLPHQPSAQISAYDAEDAFKSLNANDHELTLDHCENSNAKSPSRSWGPWAWGEEHDGLEVGRMALIDWSRHQGVWGQWLLRAASSNNWTGNCEDTCLLWGDSEGEEEVWLTRLERLVSSSHIQLHLHRHPHC